MKFTTSKTFSHCICPCLGRKSRMTLKMRIILGTTWSLGCWPQNNAFEAGKFTEMFIPCLFFPNGKTAENVGASNWISWECSSGLEVQQMYFNTDAAPATKMKLEWPSPQAFAMSHDFPWWVILKRRHCFAEALKHKFRSKNSSSAPTALWAAKIITWDYTTLELHFL